MSDRVLFQDVIPYDVPASLSDLTGPSSGSLVLPHSIYWGPQPSMDLDTVDDRSMAYQAIVREGTSAQQGQLLNADLLVALWPSLRLPVRCRTAWQARFPELTR